MISHAVEMRQRFNSIFGKRVISIEYRPAFKSMVVVWEDNGRRMCSEFKYIPRIKKISPIQEFALLLDLKFNNKVLYFDIETDDRNGKPEIGESRIVSVGMIDMDGNRYFVCEDDEKKLLQKVKEIFNNYDVYVGFYSDNFDMPFLIARGLRYGIKFDQEKHVDFYFLLERYYNIKSLMSEAGLSTLSLDSLGKHFLGMGKEIESYERGMVYSMFERDRKALERYNMRDVEILKGLDEKFGVMRSFQILADITNLQIKDVVRSLNAPVEMIIFKKILQVSKSDEEFDKYIKQLSMFARSKKKSYKGAFIYGDPRFCKNVALLDFKSMYPNIMRVSNISFDTYVGEEDDVGEGDYIKIGTHCFRKDVDGILSQISDELIRQREEFKEKGMETQENAIKLLNNAMYGYFGSEYSNFKSIVIAESITAFGRTIMSELVKHYSNTDTPIVYVHTDSMAIMNVPQDRMEEKAKEITDLARKIAIDKFNVSSDKVQYLELVPQKWFIWFEVLSKARYVGKLPDNTLFFRGVELARGDYNEFTKKLIYDVLNMLEEKSFEEIVSYIEAKKRELFMGKVEISQLAFVHKLGKMFYEYKTIPAHVRLAIKKLKEKKDDYFVSKRIAYIIVGRENGKLKVESLEDAKGYDFKENWRRTWSALERFLSIVFPPNEKFRKLGDVYNVDPRQASLENFIENTLTPPSEKDLYICV